MCNVHNVGNEKYIYMYMRNELPPILDHTRIVPPRIRAARAQLPHIAGPQLAPCRNTKQGLVCGLTAGGNSFRRNCVYHVLYHIMCVQDIYIYKIIWSGVVWCVVT